MRKFSYHIFLSVIASLLIFAACRDEDFNIKPHPETTGGIKIGARVGQVLSSRTYIQDGPVNSGTFTLYYPYYIEWQDGTSAYGKFHFLYNYGEVKFGYAGEAETGFVNVGTPTNPRELIWSSTNTGSSADDGIIYYPDKNKPSPVFLDNMPFFRRTDANTPSTEQRRDSIMKLEDLGANPFKAGVFDFENGSNDLLWGTVGAKSGEDMITIPMSHRMTRFILNVIVDNSQNSGMNIDLSEAIVYIEGLLLDPLTYLRKYGELRFEKLITTNPPTLASEIEEGLYKTRVYLVGGPNDDLEDQPEAGTLLLEPGCLWKDAPDEIVSEEQLYTTTDFVFVPQDLRQGSLTRPRLVIAVPAKDVNSGINEGYGDQKYIYYRGGIPYTMNVTNEDGSKSMMTLNFMKGQVLTLTTQMKPGSPELQFAPVTVEPWVWKGTFSPNAKQSGIFNGDDFLAMLKCYEEGNEFGLHKYGYFPTSGNNPNMWHFQFNQGNVKIPVLDVVGKMKPGTPTLDNSGNKPEYVFDFRNRVQYYVMPNGEEKMMGRTSESVLTSIVTADANSGVSTPADFNNLIKAYQSNDWQMFIYGAYNLYQADESASHDEPGKWTFKLEEGLTLDYNSIVAQMVPPNDEDANFGFEIGGNGFVTVSNTPDGSPNQVDAVALYNIVTNRLPGLYSEADFNAAISAINSNNLTDLELYGIQQPDGSWQIPLRRTFILYSKNIQGAVSNSAVTFTFDLNGQMINLQQYDNTTVNPTAEELKTILTLNRMVGMNIDEEFTTLIQSYNAGGDTLKQLSYYGYYCIGSPRWIFIFNESMTLIKSQIEKQMIPASPGKLEYTFDFNRKIIYLEEEDPTNPTELFGVQGATKLYQITSGNTPTEPDPDPAP